MNHLQALIQVRRLESENNELRGKLDGLVLRLKDGRWTVDGTATLPAIAAADVLRSAAREIETVEAMTAGTIVTRAAVFGEALRALLEGGGALDDATRANAIGWCRWMAEEFERWKARGIQESSKPKDVTP